LKGNSGEERKNALRVFNELFASIDEWPSWKRKRQFFTLSAQILVSDVAQGGNSFHQPKVAIRFDSPTVGKKVICVFSLLGESARRRDSNGFQRPGVRCRGLSRRPLFNLK
jgi:hypothetical protein